MRTFEQSWLQSFYKFKKRKKNNLLLVMVKVMFTR